MVKSGIPEIRIEYIRRVLEESSSVAMHKQYYTNRHGQKFKRNLRHVNPFDSARKHRIPPLSEKVSLFENIEREVQFALRDSIGMSSKFFRNKNANDKRQLYGIIRRGIDRTPDESYTRAYRNYMKGRGQPLPGDESSEEMDQEGPSTKRPAPDALAHHYKEAFQGQPLNKKNASMKSGEIMDTGTQSAPPEFGKTATVSSGGTGGPQMDMGMASLIRGPSDKMWTADGIRYTKLYHLVVNTTTPALVSNGQQESYWWYMPGIYYFDPSEFGMYVSNQDYAQLRAISDINANGSTNLCVETIAMSLKLLGPGAPFVSGAAGQAATNSQITMSLMSNVGLEKALFLRKFLATKNETSITDVKRINSTADAGTYTVTDSGWSLIQNPVVGIGTGDALKVKNITGSAHYAYRQYNGMTGLYAEGDKTSGAVNPCPEFGELFEEEDVTTTDKLLFTYADRPNCYIQTQTLSDRSIIMNPALFESALMTTKDVDNTNSRTMAHALADTNVVDVSGVPKDRIRIIPNNAQPYGVQEQQSLYHMPIFHMLPVAPPTISSDIIQNVQLYLVLETEIQFNLRSDVLQMGSRHAGTWRTGHARKMKSTLFDYANNNDFDDTVFGTFGQGVASVKP